MRVVLDTNVIVSALLKPEGNEGVILFFVLRGAFELCVLSQVLQEYREVLRRPRFKKLDPAHVDAALANSEKSARLVRAQQELQLSSHESDNRLYECAAAARADFIVTGNAKHFSAGHESTVILSPRKFLEVLRSIGGDEA